VTVIQLLFWYDFNIWMVLVRFCHFDA